MYWTQLYANSNSSYDKLKKIVPHFIGDTQTTLSAICGMLVNAAIFFKISKKLVAYFYGPYLENVKTQMYDILNISVYI